MTIVLSYTAARYAGSDRQRRDEIVQVAPNYGEPM